MHDLALGRYRLLQQLGAGGMADVWLAADERGGGRVAVKRLHAELAADPRMAERFRREAEATAAVDHPNVVHVVDGGPADLVLEYVPGQSLAACLQGGPLDPAAGTRVAATLASALAAVHAAGFVHRDVTPGNVIVDASGAAHLADFGIAQRFDTPDAAAVSELVGTRPYVAPEVMSGAAATPASDVWSLGATLLEALTGSPPSPEGSPGTTGPVRPVASADPSALDGLIAQALDPEPPRRPSAAAISRILAPSPEAVTEVLAAGLASPAARESAGATGGGLDAIGMARLPPTPGRSTIRRPRVPARQAAVAASGVLMAASFVLAGAGPVDPASSSPFAVPIQVPPSASPSPAPVAKPAASVGRGQGRGHARAARPRNRGRHHGGGGEGDGGRGGHRGRGGHGRG